MPTIREHILAGHYPVSEHGYAIVRLGHGTAHVVSVHAPGRKPLLGYDADNGEVMSWFANGRYTDAANSSRICDLQPPAVRIMVEADLGCFVCHARYTAEQIVTGEVPS